MTQEQFIAQGRPRWDELGALLAAVQKRGAAALSLAEVRRLGELYRLVAADLAYARTHYPHAQATGYVNELAARAHAVVYAPVPRRGRELWGLLAAGAPQAVRAASRPLALAAALLAAGALAGAAVAAAQPELARSWLPEHFRELTPAARDGADFLPEFSPLMSASILVNNLRVAALSFGLGLTLGLGTVYVLAYNGMILGVMAALFHQGGHGLTFWAFVLPHGVLELMAIALSGAAGLVLGGALIEPGRRTRGDALRQAGRRALVLMLGAGPMLAVAAAVEGYVTPLPGIGPWLKIGFGVSLGLLAAAWWAAGGRPGATPDTLAPPLAGPGRGRGRRGGERWLAAPPSQ